MIFLLLLAIHAALLLIQCTNLIYLRTSGYPAVDDALLERALPSVSIIIPARNEASNLRRLLPSIQQQTYPGFEAIIYDDDSGDDTWAVIASAASDERIRGIRGAGPPPGWVGKVHAVYQASEHALGDVLIFLDADAELADEFALHRLVLRFESIGSQGVLSGFTRLSGGGALIVSLVPHTVLTLLSWPLSHVIRSRLFTALNGQCWMIARSAYRRLQPHRQVAGEILEDVEIGRYLKHRGLAPRLVDVQTEVRVWMYEDHNAAWRGFRKNAYLLMGGRPLPFMLSLFAYAGVFVAAPVVYPVLFATLITMKFVTDRVAHMPLGVTLLAPISFAAAVVLQVDSAVSHWTGRVSWKGRPVAASPAAAARGRASDREQQSPRG